MSFFQNITRPTNLLILINKSNIILYETNGPIPIAKLTVPLGTDYSALKQFLEDFNEPVIKVVLDQTSATKNKISIPDVGRVKIEKKLKAFIKKDNPDISTSLIARVPDSVEKDWEFIITKHTLGQHTKTALVAILESNSEVQGVYLSFTSNIILCQKISKIITKEERLSRDTRLFIYLQDSNDYVFEFQLEEHKVVEIKSKPIKKERIPKYVNEKLDLHNHKSTTQKKKISALVLLPEKLRTKIHTHPEQFFRSPLDFHKKYRTNTISTQSTYTTLLCHFNFIKHNPKPLPITQVKKHKFLHLLNKSINWLFALLAVTLIYVSITMAISYRNFQNDIHLQDKRLSLLQRNYRHSFQENLVKGKMLTHNKNVQTLYNLIRFNKYSTRVLDSIEKSNTENLPIKKISYSSPIEFSHKNIIELELDQEKVTSIKTFIKNMRENLPDREIVSFVRNSGSPTIIVQILYTNPL